MRYYSFHSRAERDYVIEPYRLAYANGGMYLFAFVRAYGQLRTFAVERIRSAAMTEQRFDVTGTLAEDVFGESMGVHSGTPEAVAVRFLAEAAPHVAERVWHRKQKLEPQPDGSLIVRLLVVVDFALQAWILSFGPLAQVLAPAHLAQVGLRARQCRLGAVDRQSRRPYAGQGGIAAAAGQRAKNRVAAGARQCAARHQPHGDQIG